MAGEEAQLRAPRGTHDILPPQSRRWEQLVARFSLLAHRYGFGLVINPMFEDARLFHRGIGDESEVVGKEMYEFDDRGGRHLALRPEGTAPVVRAFVEHHPPVPWKAWYASPAFRYERAAAGRYRQHHQLGVEVLGVDDPAVDVEVVSLAAQFYASLGLERIELLLNSMGCPDCRRGYIVALREYLDDHAAELCDEHRERYSKNPLRVLDCKNPACRAATEAAPRLLDWLDEACAEHFAKVREGLEAARVSYTVETRLVRGFDYYTRTTFEFAGLALEGAQNAIGGGGRYNGLVELIGGPPTAGIGFGIGIERVLLACDAEGVFAVPSAETDVFVVDMTGGDAARDLVFELREGGLAVERAYDGRSTRSQMKLADRSGAKLALIIGDEELKEGVVTVRFLREEADQYRVPRGEVLEKMLGAISPDVAGSSKR